ncbi:sorting nexin-2-like isoform X2 [Centruroides vittatus]|uniref:sorting nexin-2-like isoform X2 n=1 Tax=Centruroides vittatus TaxID=120091 RepID=UPI00350FEB1D
MADDRVPPPLVEEDDSTVKEDTEDLFISAVDTQLNISNGDKKAVPPNTIEDLMAGGGVEVNLDDDVPLPTPQSKLEFCTPEEEFSKDIPTLDKSKETSVENDNSTAAEITPSQPVKSTTKKSAKSGEELEEDQFLEITVDNPHKIGDGMGAYVVYKVTTKTNLPYFKKKLFSVSRRFSDFLGLHDKLVERHLHLGRIVPPAPEKSVIGMTKIKMSKDETVSSTDFIEKRRAALERYLNRTASHPVLRMDPDFRDFLETEAELPKATNTSALSGAGVIRLFNRVGDTVNKMTFKMDESDPWFEEKQHQIENLDQQLRKLHSSVEALVHHRKELSSSTASFAKSAAMMGNCEEHTALSRALSQLAEVEEKIEQLQCQQANHDFYLLSELLKDYISLIAAVKDVFHQRVKVYQTWQHALQILTKKREQKAKLELAGKTDKIPQAREEVIEWEAKVERGQEEFENISKMIRKEVERFEQTRVQDFKATIIKYMEQLLETQQQLIKYWEGFIPEAKAIA